MFSIPKRVRDCLDSVQASGVGSINMYEADMSCFIREYVGCVYTSGDCVFDFLESFNVYL